MVVQHNLQAMNANRMLGITTSSSAKSIEKLSSGYKINRAADDAAGLSISEKMRKQIRGLTQASANAQDGISAVQTAEGALGEVHDMLQRMNELAVKSANGTNSESDRKSIQDEIDQLTTEIDRVSETTKFNETYLLKGDANSPKIATFKYANYTDDKAATVTGSKEGTLKDSATNATMTVEFEASASMAYQNEVAKSLVSAGVNVTITDTWGFKTSAEKKGANVETFSIKLNGDAAQKFNVVTKNEDGSKAEIQDKAGHKIATLSFDNGDINIESDENNKFKQTSVTLSAKSATAANNAGKKAALYDKDGNKISEAALSNYYAVSSVGSTTTQRKADAGLVYDALGNSTLIDPKLTVAESNLTADLNVRVHVGADATSNNQINLDIAAMSAKGLGVNGLRVDGSDDTNARDAIQTIASAISKVSAQRSSLGAAQNRLEHTIKNLDNIVENTTSAESAIRDTDMASEMVTFSKNNILKQAGQSMLAQANQSNQGVLSLLQ